MQNKNNIRQCKINN